jgi:hypothetical protein
VSGYQGREPSIWDAFERVFKPSEAIPLTAPQQETWADGEVSREAVSVCRQLSDSDYNAPDCVAMRQTWKGREHEYLYARFANALGWRSHDDARRFFNKHKAGWLR